MTPARFERLGQRLRDDLARHQSGPSEARVRRQLLARRDLGKTPRRWGLWALPAVAAMVALFAVFSWTRVAEAPLEFWVEDRSGQVDEWVTARDAEQSLRFSDGSSVVVGPRTTTRVMQVTPDGARLTLERGRLDAHVVHREASRWQVAAGPFSVRVTGTRFRVNWDPQAELLAVTVSEGRVEVTGGGHPKHELTAGSGLELHVGGAPPLAAPSAEAEAAPDRATSEGARDEDELIRSRKEPAERKPDFRELSTSGRYREALAAVEQLGFAAECERLGARDLLTLGSTARLAGRAERASEAYTAVQRRFPSSAEAAISAFSLGRLASDAGRTGDAIGWFKRYLAAQPGGQLAREAAGRLIELFQKSGDSAQARSMAESYLKQHPTGPHAALARSVLARP